MALVPTRKQDPETGEFVVVMVESSLPESFPEPDASVISRRQFFQQMSRSGEPPYISRANALAVLGSGIPPEMAVIIATLDEQAQENAEFLVGGAREFDIADPLVAGFAAYLGLSGQQVQDLWNAAAKL